MRRPATAPPPVQPAPTMRLAAGAGFVVAIAAVANLLNNRWLPGAYLLTCTASALAALSLARSDGLTWAELGLGAGTRRRGLQWAGRAATLVAGGYAVAGTLPRTRPVFLDQRAPLRLGGVVYAALVPVLSGTVLLEEVIFRGVLWGLFNRGWGAGWATAGSSVLFGLWHLLPARTMVTSNRAVGDALGTGPAAGRAATVASMVVTTVGGLVFSELRRRSGSLLAPAGLHWATNGLGYLAAWLVTGRRGGLAG